MGCVCAGIAALAATLALASNARAADERPAWMARLQAGVSLVTPSEEQDLLSADGYVANTRFVATADWAHLVTPIVAIGGWAEFAHRGADAAPGGPSFDELVGAGGAEVAVLPVGWDIATLVLTPKIGYGASWMSIGGHPRPVGGVAYGLDFSVMFPRLHILLTIGFLNGPTGAPGAVGRSSNFGGVRFLGGAVIDG
jgi:hypothetical protein